MAANLVPLVVGQEPCREPRSSTPSVFREKNSTARGVGTGKIHKTPEHDNPWEVAAALGLQGEEQHCTWGGTMASGAGAWAWQPVGSCSQARPWFLGRSTAHCAGGMACLCLCAWKPVAAGNHRSTVQHGLPIAQWRDSVALIQLPSPPTRCGLVQAPPSFQGCQTPSPASPFRGLTDRPFIAHSL